MKFSRSFSTVDTHTGGEPTRTVIGGMPSIPGKTMAEKMLFMEKNLDWVRTCLMYEPRGHNVMSGVILTEPCSSEADFGVIFIETGGYLPMCGHDTIGVSTALIETGMVSVKEPETTIILDTPAGLTEVVAQVEANSARWVSFRGVPSFLFARDAEVEVPGYGNIILDIGYGGNTYAIVKADLFGLEIRSDQAAKIIETGRVVRDAVNAQFTFQHPQFSFVNKCTHVEFYGPPSNKAADAQNAVLFGDVGIDRSPCGTGTSAKLAALYARGELGLDQEFVHESIIGSLFKAKIIDTTEVGEYQAVIPRITGSAHLMSMNTIFIDPDDPHKHGFLLL